MTTLAALDRVRDTRLPKAGLATLAHLRNQQEIRVVEFADGAWIFWEGERPTVLQLLLGIPNVELFVPKNSDWVRIDRHVPTFAVPDRDASTRLENTILPLAVQPTLISESTFQRISVSPVRCEKAHPTSAVCCEIEALRTWADTALTREINAIRAARKGKMAWLLGSDLPVLAKAERFWGNKLLVPLGYRPEPAWPESVLVDVAGIEKGELLVLRPDRVETLPLDAFQHLTRAAIRLAVLE